MEIVQLLVNQLPHSKVILMVRNRVGEVYSLLYLSSIHLCTSQFLSTSLYPFLSLFLWVFLCLSPPPLHLYLSVSLPFFLSFPPQGLLPRGERQNPLREKNADVNRLLQVSVSKLSPVQFLDLSSGFIHSDGTISSRDMFDYLHLTAAGYRKVAKPLHELLLQIVEETPEENQPALA